MQAAPKGDHLTNQTCKTSALLLLLREVSNSVRHTLLLLATLSCCFTPCAVNAAELPPPRERVAFNADWLFMQGDPADTTASLDYHTLKPLLLSFASEAGLTSVPANLRTTNPGGGVPYAQPGYDDSSWRHLNLPHDWGIEAPFKQEYESATAKLPYWGVAWYRKQFHVPASDAGRQLFLDLDGAMSYASVWVNGHWAGGWPYGYSSWRVALTPFIKPGAENLIAIRLDNPPDSSRWYPGGGIYRNVWLVKTAPVHVAHWGTYITTPEVTPSAAKVNLQVSLNNSTSTTAQAALSAQIYQLDSQGHRTGSAVGSFNTVNLSVGLESSATATLTTTLSNPLLWDVKNPNRYVAVTTVTQDSKVVDVYETPFGLRTIQFTADNGFLLNGSRVQLQGVCEHHDLGALGSAFHTRAQERKLQLLQEMGCNAIRTAHNPPAPELLELCDRMGLLVVDEAFDCWQKAKKPNDYHLLFPEWHSKDLRALVRRDRNHPSVIAWSIGNEIPEQTTSTGLRIASELAAIVHAEDPTRPVTAACNAVQAGYNGFQRELDVFGYNYKPTEYGKFHTANPQIPLIGAETASCVSSRDEYFFPVSENKDHGKANFQVSSYDLYAPRWATPPDAEFDGQDKFPFVAGEFVWTGFDYLGEPTPYNGDSSNLLNFTDPVEKSRMEKELNELGKIPVPSRSSYFGIFDLAGFKKDRFYIYQSRWRPDLPMVHILPHWNWPERVGQITPVHIYTSGDEAELFLNGTSLGRKSKSGKHRLRWDDVVYQPGELKAIAYKQGRVWAETVVKSTGPAEQLTLSPDRTVINADGHDLSFVTVTVADNTGQRVPRSHNLVAFEISGPGEILAVDNGDATSFDSFQAKTRTAYNGLCLAIVRSTGMPGTITLTATTPGLRPAKVELTSK